MPRIVVLEFSDYECKVVEADSGKGGHPVVRFIGTLPLTKPDELKTRVSERGQAIKDYLKANRISTRRTAIIIPKNFVMVRTAQLPSHVDEEIAGMARFEAERHIPFNADRHVVSYHVLAKQGVQGSDVLLAAIDSPIAKEYMDTAAAAGLNVLSAGVSSIAAFNAFVAAEPTALADRTVMMVNIGRGASDLVIATNGVVTFTRGATIGVEKLLAAINEYRPDSPVNLLDLPLMDALEPHLFFNPAAKAAEKTPVVPDYDALPPVDSGGLQTDGSAELPAVPGMLASQNETNGLPPNPETLEIASTAPSPADAVSPENPAALAFTAWLNKVLQEVKRTYEFASREFNCPMIAHIYLCGEGAAIKNIAQYFVANFGIECSLFDPLQAGQTSAKALKGMPGLPQAFAATIGGAVEKVPQSIHVNLIPEQFTEARNVKRQQVGYIITGVLVLIALVLGYVYLMDMFSLKRGQLEDLVSQNKKDKARVTDLNAKRERLRIIKENVQDEQGALDVLERLSSNKLIPEKATLTSFEYKRGDHVTVEGDAKDLATANQIVSDLKATGYFVDGNLDNTDPNKILRGRPPIPVLGWAATWTFPKPEKNKSSSSSHQTKVASSSEGGE